MIFTSQLCLEIDEYDRKNQPTENDENQPPTKKRIKGEFSGEKNFILFSPIISIIVLNIIILMIIERKIEIDIKYLFF